MLVLHSVKWSIQETSICQLGSTESQEDEEDDRELKNEENGRISRWSRSLSSKMSSGVSCVEFGEHHLLAFWHKIKKRMDETGSENLSEIGRAHV